MANAWVSIPPGSQRADDWQFAFGRLTDIPVRGWIPFVANLPGFYRPQFVYLLDLAKITAAERERLAQRLAERFGYALNDVLDHMAMEGVPILADGVSVSTTDPLPLLMANDLEPDDWDDDSDDD